MVSALMPLHSTTVKVRRALGYGMVACGASVGGVVFPITVRKLLPLVGFTWTMRITGFIVLFTLSLGMCLVRLRLPPRDVKGGLFNFGIFKNPAYAVYGLGTFIGFTGLYTGALFCPRAVIDFHGCILFVVYSSHIH